MSRVFRRVVWSVVAACGLGSSPQAQEAKPHGDHNPHHGGIVLMYGLDLHYEVVLQPNGTVQLWLSDAAREELPAATVSEVAVEIERQGARREVVEMDIGDSGESWEGKGAAVKEEGTVLHLAFVFRGEPAVVSFPATALMGAGRDRLMKEAAHGPTHDATAHAGHEGHNGTG